METNNQNDDLIGNVMANPEKAIQDLQKAAQTIQDLQKAASGAQQDIQNAMQEDVNEESEGRTWSDKDIIDALFNRATGGYTYYDVAWDDRNRTKTDDRVFNILDDSGDIIERNKLAQQVLDFANTLFHYDMSDNDEPEFKTFDEAKSALESQGYKVVNVDDTNQLDMFPDDMKKPEVKLDYSKVVSKMSDSEYERMLDNMDPVRANTIKKSVILLKSNKQQDAYKTLRSFVDYLNREKINESSFENSELFRIIAESETPKLTKQDILTFIKNKK